MFWSRPARISRAVYAEIMAEDVPERVMAAMAEMVGLSHLDRGNHDILKQLARLSWAVQEAEVFDESDDQEKGGPRAWIPYAEIEAAFTRSIEAARMLGRSSGVQGAPGASAEPQAAAWRACAADGITGVESEEENEEDSEDSDGEYQVPDDGESSASDDDLDDRTRMRRYQCRAARDMLATMGVLPATDIIQLSDDQVLEATQSLPLAIQARLVHDASEALAAKKVNKLVRAHNAAWDARHVAARVAEEEDSEEQDQAQSDVEDQCCTTSEDEAVDSVSESGVAVEPATVAAPEPVPIPSVAPAPISAVSTNSPASTPPTSTPPVSEAAEFLAMLQKLQVTEKDLKIVDWSQFDEYNRNFAGGAFGDSPLAQLLIKQATTTAAGAPAAAIDPAAFLGMLQKLQLAEKELKAVDWAKFDEYNKSQFGGVFGDSLIAQLFIGQAIPASAPSCALPAASTPPAEPAHLDSQPDLPAIPTIPALTSSTTTAALPIPAAAAARTPASVPQLMVPAPVSSRPTGPGAPPAQTPVLSSLAKASNDKHPQPIPTPPSTPAANSKSKNRNGRQQINAPHPPAAAKRTPAPPTKQAAAARSNEKMDDPLPAPPIFSWVNPKEKLQQLTDAERKAGTLDSLSRDELFFKLLQSCKPGAPSPVLSSSPEQNARSVLPEPSTKPARSSSTFDWAAHLSKLPQPQPHSPTGKLDLPPLPTFFDCSVAPSMREIHAKLPPTTSRKNWLPWLQHYKQYDQPAADALLAKLAAKQLGFDSVPGATVKAHFASAGADVDRVHWFHYWKQCRALDPHPAILAPLAELAAAYVIQWQEETLESLARAVVPPPTPAGAGSGSAKSKQKGKGKKKAAPLVQNQIKYEPAAVPLQIPAHLLDPIPTPCPIPDEIIARMGDLARSLLDFDAWAEVLAKLIQGPATKDAIHEMLAVGDAELRMQMDRWLDAIKRTQDPELAQAFAPFVQASKGGDKTKPLLAHIVGASMDKYKTRTHDHHLTIFHPNRCELAGCNAPVPSLKTCTGCKCVRYCSPAHQQADWDTHKKDCAGLQRVGLKVVFFTDKEMLAKFPLRARGALFDKHITRRKLGDECEICHVHKSEAKLVRAYCCGITICKTEEDVVEGTFTRDACFRSHFKYAMCVVHYHGESKCNAKVDWRECGICLKIATDRGKPGYFNLLSRYGVMPALAKHVPRHFICDACDGCGRSYVAAVEGKTVSPSLGHLCRVCTPPPPGMPPHCMTTMNT